MTAFVWNESFLTGLESVDQQHHELVDLINRLSGSLSAGGTVDDAAVTATFDALRDYAQYHFAEEEKIREQSGIDERHQEIHRLAHAQFIAQIASLWNSRSAMSNPSETILGFLSSWLAHHILGIDQSMARQIRLVKAGETAGRAFEMEVHREDPQTETLLQALNNLYHALSRQNTDLAAANLSLEQRVRDRTLELERANLALTEANRQLELLARMDGLLGIANRKCFDERYEQEWLRARRDRLPLALLMIDVDSFKRFNDAYGHQAGDRCLQSIASTVKGLFRRPADLVARYGGEELIVVLPNTGLAGARHKAREICARIDALAIPHRDSDAAGHVTVSIGATSAVPDARSSPASLLACADRALYRAKELGRNRVCEESESAQA